MAFHKELKAITNLISATKSLIRVQKESYILDPRVIHTRRKCSPLGPSLSTSRPRENASVPEQNTSSILPVPEAITLERLEVLGSLESEIRIYRQNVSTTARFPLVLASTKYEGTKVLAFWSQQEIGDTGWKSGKELQVLLNL